MRLARGHPPRPQIPTTPLANLALLVLTSVMIAGMFSASRGPGLRFASPSAGGGFDDRGAVRVEVDSGRQILVDGVPATLAGLSSSVKQRLMGREDGAVVLAVSPDADYQAMIDAYAVLAALPGPPRIALPFPHPAGERMTTHRSLLKLEDKLAGEGRRLAQLGGPSLGQLVPLMIVAALALHGGLLLLPLMRIGGSLPASSPPQDFPLVWRTTTPVAPTVSAPEEITRESARRVVTPSPAPVYPARMSSMEPVPEPSPEFAAGALSVDVDAVIPPPDSPPPAFDPGPAATPPPPSRATPVLVHRVPPVYPVGARSLRAEARVTVRLTVGSDGRVEETSVLGCTRPGVGFEAAALDSVRRWRYEPQPVPTGVRTVIVTVEFKRDASRP